MTKSFVKASIMVAKYVASVSAHTKWCMALGAYIPWCLE